MDADMSFLYALHLILAGLMGIHSKIVTVSQVSVKTGDSISIPCLYEEKYEDKVKYLCKGNSWLPCDTVVDTNNNRSGKFSISDDKQQRIFTVTINDLTVTDMNSHYWCAVDMVVDVKQHFDLSVTKGVPSLYVDQQRYTAFEGGSVTIECHFQNQKVREWCRLRITGNKCVKQTGSIDRMTVTINARVQKVFTVTMSKLRIENSGWYWCAKRDFQIPVHITVLQSTLTTTTTMSPTTAITETLPTTTQYSSLFTSAEPHTAQPTNSSVNGSSGGSLQDEKKSSTMVTILIPILILLLLVVSAAIFGWRMMIKRNHTKPDIAVSSHNGGDPDVQYATIAHNQHAAAQQKQNEESVTYSTIVLKESVRQMAEPADASVIYSTVHK